MTINTSIIFYILNEEKHIKLCISDKSHIEFSKPKHHLKLEKLLIKSTHKVPAKYWLINMCRNKALTQKDTKEAYLLTLEALMSLGFIPNLDEV